MTKTSFTEADVRRAVKGAKAAGLDIGSVRIQPDGCIVIITIQAATDPGTEFDKWIASRARST